MITVKDTQELDNTISHYSSYLSDVIDVMAGVPVYLKRQLKSSLEDMVESYRKMGIPPKQISINKDKEFFEEFAESYENLTKRFAEVNSKEPTKDEDDADIQAAKEAYQNQKEEE